MTKKIVSFDLETGPNLGWVWGKYDQNVIKFEQEWQLLSFSYKELGKKARVVGQDTLTEQELVKQLWNLFDDSDVLIAHNAYKFDIRKANAKFLEYGMAPPSPYKVIDTLRVARRYFALNSNKLNDLAILLGLKPKLETGGFDTWLGCLRGDKKAWKTMLRYNKYDSELLEDVYLALRPWMTNHPNLGDLNELDGVCPKCLSTDLEKRGFNMRRSGKVQRYQCQGCGGWTNESKLKENGRLVNA